MNALNDLLYAAFGDLISALVIIPVTVFTEVLIAILTALFGASA